jgi:hypothetical protein
MATLKMSQEQGMTLGFDLKGKGMWEWFALDDEGGRQEKGWRTRRFAQAMEIRGGYEMVHIHNGFDWQSLGKSTVVDVSRECKEVGCCRDEHWDRPIKCLNRHFEISVSYEWHQSVLRSPFEFNRSNTRAGKCSRPKAAYCSFLNMSGIIRILNYTSEL